MKIPQKLKQFTEEKALLIVSAKEQGLLYVANDGVIEQVVNINEHPEVPSDNEGFFFRSGYGKHYGSGGPDAGSGVEDLRTFVKAIAEELNEAIIAEKPDVLYFFQPEHLQGYLESAIKNPTHIPTHVVKLGNFHHATPLELIEFIEEYHDESIDPSDPASVGDEPNAEEKRKLLEKGRN